MVQSHLENILNPLVGCGCRIGRFWYNTSFNSDIKGVKYTEGRFLPYFFPDVFHENGDPLKEAKVNWVTARRAILRSPVDRIGYGGYLKLALDFPEFVIILKRYVTNSVRYILM